MKQLRDNRSKITSIVAEQLAAVQMVSESNSLPNSTRGQDFAPTLCSGCISDVSSAAIHGYKHDYAAAMKSYAAVYENFQSYLEPANTLAAHDYNLSTVPVPEHEHLGCIDQEFMECTTRADSVSDEEIESCGYLGWLRH
jgi:hypothetical protein